MKTMRPASVTHRPIEPFLSFVISGISTSPLPEVMPRNEFISGVGRIIVGDLKMNGWNPLKVDVLKVIENFMDMYPYPASETLVVEAIANCLDAKATEIAISIIKDDRGKVFRVEDNGEGMTKKGVRGSLSCTFRIF